MAEDILVNLEITPREVQERLERGADFLLIDVREKWEHDAAQISGARLIPLQEIPAHLAELEEAGEIVLFCHRGMRSIDAAAWLRSQGVAGARSMSGGIERWSMEIDSGVPHY